jgi:hypothetical protein
MTKEMAVFRPSRWWAVGWLYCKDVGCLASILEVNTSSVFRTEFCRMGKFLFVYRFSFDKMYGKCVVGDTFRPIEMVEWETAWDYHCCSQVAIHLNARRAYWCSLAKAMVIWMYVWVGSVSVVYGRVTCLSWCSIVRYSIVWLITGMKMALLSHEKL